MSWKLFHLSKFQFYDGAIVHNLDGAKEQFYNLNLVLSTQLIQAIKKTYTVGDTIELLCSYNNSYIGWYIKWTDWSWSVDPCHTQF